MQRKMFLILCRQSWRASYRHSLSAEVTRRRYNQRQPPPARNCWIFKAAYDEGVITEWQYEQQREKLLRAG